MMVTTQKIDRFTNGIPKILRNINTESQSAREELETQIFNTYEIRFNGILNTFEFRVKGDPEYRKMKKEEVERTLAYNSIKYKKGEVEDILNSGIVPEYNPFEYYFKNLKYDRKNKPDYIGELLKFIYIKGDEKESAWFENHLRKCLIRCIACALEDGRVNKQAFVLFGDEHNSGKSSFIRWFRPVALKDYFTEDLNSNNHKDAEISLGSNFIINMDELAGLDKAEKEHLKGMMSRDYVKVRRPYGKEDVFITRRANFFGSTNNMEFLTDITGSVRWLIFEVEKIDWDYSKEVNIDDIWAQAYNDYLEGKEYNLTKAEVEENEKRNKRHNISFSELELVAKYCERGNKVDGELLTSTEVLEHLLDRTGHHLRLSVVMVGRALGLLKYEKGSDREEGYPVKKYYVKRMMS